MRRFVERFTVVVLAAAVMALYVGMAVIVLFEPPLPVMTWAGDPLATTAPLRIHLDAPVAMFHQRCGGLAFFVDHRPVSGGLTPRADQVRLVDGRRPTPWELARCGTCGRVIAWTFRATDGLCVEGECP